MRYLCRFPAAIVTALALLCPTVGAQDAKEVARLQQLLEELSKTKPTAWQSRLQQLEARAAAHDKKAKALRDQAAGETKQAQAARTEIAHLRKVMELLGKAKPTPTKPAPAKPVPAKPVPAKPVPAKPVPAKPSPKDSAPAKSAPAKSVPAKPAPAKKAPPKVTPTKRTPAAAPAMATAVEPTGEIISYDEHVREIFMEHCSVCHDADEKESGLDLTSFATARAGGSSGQTIVPGDIDNSRLYQLVAHLQRPTMPPDEDRIDRKKVELIRRWILGGAPENQTDAVAYAAKKKLREQSRPPALRPAFAGPAPVPKGWAKVDANPTRRPVRVKTIAASPRSPLLAIPGLGQVFVLDSADHRSIGILPFEHGDVEVLAFSADGGRLLVAGGTPGKRGHAVLYNVADGKIAGRYGKEYDTVIAAAVHPQLTHVALGGSSRRVRVYDARDGALAYEIKDHNEWVLGVDFSSDGKHLVSVDRAGVIVVTEARTGRNVDVIRRHRGAIHAVRFAPTGRIYATVGADRTLRLFDTRGARQITQRDVGARPLCVAFSPDGKQIAVGTEDGRARLYRSNAAPITTLPSVGDWIYSVAFDKDGKTLFAGDWSGITSVFDLSTRRRKTQLAPSAPVQTAPPTNAPSTASAPRPKNQ